MSPSPVVPDLSGLVAQVKRVADALYTDEPVKWGLAGSGPKGLADVTNHGNEAVATVIGIDVKGDSRVRTDPNVPA